MAVNIRAVFFFTTENLHIDDNPLWTESDPLYVRFIAECNSIFEEYLRSHAEYDVNTFEMRPRPLNVGPGTSSDTIRRHLEAEARKDYGPRPTVFHCADGGFGLPHKGFLAVC